MLNGDKLKNHFVHPLNATTLHGLFKLSFISFLFIAILILYGCNAGPKNTLLVKNTNGLLMPVEIKKSRVSPESLYAQHVVTTVLQSNNDGKRADAVPLESIMKTPINPQMPLRWLFTEGTVQFVPKEPIEVFYVAHQGKILFIGIRKGWDDSIDFQYSDKISCSGKLLIDYFNGDWTEAELGSPTELSIMHNRIKIAGKIDLKTAKSFLKRDNLTLQNEFLVQKDRLWSIKNCPAIEKDSYELYKIYKHYALKVAHTTSSDSFMITMNVTNNNGSYLNFCTQR